MDISYKSRSQASEKPSFQKVSQTHESVSIPSTRAQMLINCLCHPIKHHCVISNSKCGPLWALQLEYGTLKMS